MTVECARRERDKSYAFESWTNDDDGGARTAITWPQVALKAFKPLSLSTALCLSLHFSLKHYRTVKSEVNRSAQCVIETSAKPPPPDYFLYLIAQIVFSFVLRRKFTLEFCNRRCYERWCRSQPWASFIHCTSFKRGLCYPSCLVIDWRVLAM